MYATFFLLASCSTLKPEYELLISEKEKYYAINPATTLISISQGQIEDAFIPHSAETFDENNKQTIHWSADEYFLVAWSLNQVVGNGSVDDWNIKRVIFDYDCVNTGMGFERGRIRLFKVGIIAGKESRTVLDIDLMPTNKVIRIGEGIYSPIVEKWDALDLNNIKISAEQAIKIAEQNGGKNARNKVANECFVSIDLLTGGLVGYNGWTVSYRVFNAYSSLETMFEVLIDPQNGNFQVVTPR